MPSYRPPMSKNIWAMLIAGYVFAQLVGIDRHNVLWLRPWVYFILIPSVAISAALLGWRCYVRDATDVSPYSMYIRKRLFITLAQGAGAAFVTWHAACLIADGSSSSSRATSAQIVEVQSGWLRSTERCATWVRLRLDSGEAGKICARSRLGIKDLWVGVVEPATGGRAQVLYRKGGWGAVVDRIAAE